MGANEHSHIGQAVQRSDVTAELKAWTTLRATAAMLKLQCFRTDPLDGPICYFTGRHGVITQHADLRALRTRVEEDAAWARDGAE